MPIESVPVEFVAALEPRRLMSFTPVGREGLVANGGGYGSYDAAVAADGSSWVASVTLARSPSLGRNVNLLGVQKYDPLGRPVGGRVEVSRYVQTNSGVSLDTNAAGQAVIAYVERRGEFEVLATRRVDTLGLGEAADPGLRLATRSVRVGDNVPPSAFGTAKVAMDNTGGYFVAYRAADENDLRVQYVYPGPNGMPTGITALENATTSTGSYRQLLNFDLATRPDGLGAVFTANVLGNGTSGIVYGRLSRTAKVGADGRLDRVLDGVDPAVAVAANGAFVISYSENTLADNFGGAGTAAQRFDANGVPQGAPVRFEGGLPSDGGPLESRNTSIAATPDGGFVAAFGVIREDADGQFTPGPVYARRYAADGTPDESGPVALGSGGYGPTAIDADAYGNALVAYAKPTADSGATIPVGLRRVTSGMIVDRFEAYVVGTSGDDVIRVDAEKNNRVRVTVNDQTRLFPVAYVGAVSVLGLAGNDRIDLLRAVPATVSGGAGNDTVFGSEAADVLRGDHGDDRLYGHGGNDLLVGGRGVDFLRGGPGRDSLEGDGSDTVVAP